MKQLDLYHHKFIMALLIIVVFVIGVLFGVKITEAAGETAMLVLLFGLLFLNSVLLYVLFTQVIHVRDDICTGYHGKRSGTKKPAGKRPKRRRR